MTDAHASPVMSAVRMRRLRGSEAMRRLVRETRLHPSQFIWPLFVRSGTGVRTPIGSMPGVSQTSVDELLRDAERAMTAGLGGILLFGIPDTKDAVGSSAWDPHGPVPEAVRAVKREFPDLLVITDVCMCEYTDHGHCGLLTPVATWTTTPRWRCWRRKRWPMPRRARTSWPRAT